MQRHEYALCQCSRSIPHNTTYNYGIKDLIFIFSPELPVSG
ncbi:hypothetical protein C1O63_0130 [Dehalococcoides mccartyi]|nr:hypothetical protein C1O63_0130 [Dehalococcoides mccartyi]